MNKKELIKAFNEKLIDEEQFKNELFKLETQIKERKRKPQRLPKSLTPEEFKKLISVIPEKDKINKTAFLLAYGSGLRISEIVGGKGNDIKPLTKEQFNLDLNPPQIIIYGKYSKERVVPIPKGFKDYMFKLFPIKKTSRSLERAFKKYSSLAELNKDYTFHSLRHGFATRLSNAGVPISHIQYLLGHENLSTTSIYSKARPTDALKSYEDLF